MTKKKEGATNTHHTKLKYFGIVYTIYDVAIAVQKKKTCIYTYT